MWNNYQKSSENRIPGYDSNDTSSIKIKEQTRNQWDILIGGWAGGGNNEEDLKELGQKYWRISPNAYNFTRARSSASQITPDLKENINNLFTKEWNNNCSETYGDFCNKLNKPGMGPSNINSGKLTPKSQGNDYRFDTVCLKSCDNGQKCKLCGCKLNIPNDIDG